MFLPHTFEIALIMMIASTICWGSWANTYKLTKNYRFELAYWDFALGVLIISLVFAWTMGSTSGGELSFTHNVASASTINMVYAAIGGFIFNIANVLLVAGIEIAGLSVAFPLSIGIALVEGVVLSYAIQPKGSASFLTAGVVVALVAVILIGKAYGNLHRPGSVATRKGIIICIISGILMGAFAPFDTRALTAAHPLTPYSIAVFFAVGIIISCIVFNPILMRKPLIGEPVDPRDYFRSSPSEHGIALIGGFIWGVGMTFNLVAAGLVGMSISYAIGQASPMVAALWGVLAFHEFRGASARARMYLIAMFICYILALILISYAHQTS